MKRAGILVMVAAFALSACTTRKAAGVSTLVGVGMMMASPVVTSTDDSEPNQVGPSGAQLAGAGLLLTGIVVASVSALGVVALPDEQPAHRTLSLPANDGLRTEQLAQMKRVASRLAKDGHCDQVRDLGVQLASADPAFHGGVFVRDKAIKRCLLTGSRY